MKKSILVALAILSGFTIYIVNRGLTNKSLDTMTIGHVVAKQSQYKKVDKLRVKFKAKGKQYSAYFSPSKDAYDIIQKGYKVMVKYSNTNPNKNLIVPHLKNGDFSSDSIQRVGRILKVEKNTQLNFLIDKFTFNEIFFSYSYDNIRYDGVCFAPIDSIPEIGTEYVVHIDPSYPDMGILNTSKPYDEKALINSIVEFEKQMVTVDSVSQISDSIIDGDTIQVLDLVSE